MVLVPPLSMSRLGALPAASVAGGSIVKPPDTTTPEDPIFAAVREWADDPRFDVCECGHARHRHAEGPCNLAPFSTVGLSAPCHCSQFRKAP